MNVPLLDLKAQYLAIKTEVDAAVAEVMESQHFILGPKVEQCELGIETLFWKEEAKSFKGSKLELQGEHDFVLTYKIGDQPFSIILVGKAEG